MKLQIIDNYGDYSVFEAAEREIPIADSNEVVINITATSVNPIDCKTRQGVGPQHHLPTVLGCDVSGVITAVGKDISEFSIGDNVYGCIGGVPGMNGALAEYIAADPKLLCLAPASLPIEESATLPLVSITAWEGLITKADIQSGDHILIHGGTGGVGHIAIQIAKAKGAIVSTTVSTQHKAELAKALGADNIALYPEETVAQYKKRLTNDKGFDVVFDTTGGNDIQASFEAAKLNGQVVTIVSRYEADLTLMHQKSLTLHVVFMLIPLIHNCDRKKHGDILQEISRLVDNGELKPLIDEKRFKLEHVSRAHQHLESGNAIGKVIVEIAQK